MLEARRARVLLPPSPLKALQEQERAEAPGILGRDADAGVRHGTHASGPGQLAATTAATCPPMLNPVTPSRFTLRGSRPTPAAHGPPRPRLQKRRDHVARAAPACRPGRAVGGRRHQMGSRIREPMPRASSGIAIVRKRRATLIARAGRLDAERNLGRAAPRGSTNHTCAPALDGERSIVDRRLSSPRAASRRPSLTLALQKSIFAPTGRPQRTSWGNAAMRSMNSTSPHPSANNACRRRAKERGDRASALRAASRSAGPVTRPVPAMPRRSSASRTGNRWRSSSP